jgi:hypothetical protein
MLLDGAYISSYMPSSCDAIVKMWFFMLHVYLSLYMPPSRGVECWRSSVMQQKYLYVCGIMHFTASYQSLQQKKSCDNSAALRCVTFTMHYKTTKAKSNSLSRLKQLV